MCVSGKDRRFILTGDGSLIDNLGTSTGSRTVQSYKGRAQISVWPTADIRCSA
jgi:beta-galactosidase